MGALYREAPGDQSLRALIGQWPSAHYQTYNNAYAALIAKRLIEATDAQAIRLTEMGRRAIGIVSTTVSTEAPRKVQQPPRARTHSDVSAHEDRCCPATAIRCVGSGNGDRQ